MVFTIGSFQFGEYYTQRTAFTCTTDQKILIIQHDNDTKFDNDTSLIYKLYEKNVSDVKLLSRDRYFSKVETSIKRDPTIKYI
jgi:hypothetical protein